MSFKVKNDAPRFHNEFPIGISLLKTFGDKQYLGKVTSFDPDNGYYFVKYEDGDREEMEEEELAEWVEAHHRSLPPKKTTGKRKKKDLTPPPPAESDCDDELSDSPPTVASAKRKAAAKKRKNSTTPPMETEEDSEDDEQVSETASPPRKRAARRSKSPDSESEDSDVLMEEARPRRGSSSGAARGRRSGRSAQKKISYADEYDENEFTDSHDEDSEEEKVRQAQKKHKAKPTKPRGKPKRSDSDDEFDVEGAASSSEDEEMEFESESEDEAPRRKKKKGKASKKTAAKKAAVPAAKDTGTKPKQGKKMCDMFQPINPPLYKTESLEEIHQKHDFLDPCGMEGSDDIVDRLVGEQVDKIGALLQGALKSKDIGSAANPLQLGTACSGTDAPALALNLVQEQMELRGLGDLFAFTHEFSCENDPFKQAYLERNFDSTLYPDITKLSDETPLDVYGQEKPIPNFNLFVAGTSCKNFSMLRSKRRLDIEDKGCSGETFLAAVELLFKEKPKTAIFENVTKAPWAKMQEYIRGRIKLSDCASTKAIKENKDKNKELTFVLDEDNQIVVDRVPAVYGVRAGSVVEGFLRPGETDVNPVKMKGKSCTLSELIKTNGISRANDTLVFETPCTFCTEIVKVDTKQFGLPQTRERMYMFVWQPDDDDVNDDLGEYWKKIVEHLKSPVRHSLQSFVLQDDHDTIRVFREALRGPPGRQSARGVMQEPDFWTSASANLPHNKIAREKLGLADEARFITNWEAYGKKQIPPHYWLEYMRCVEQRRMDLTDILHASAMRDAEAHDSSFVSFYWNTTQNASKEKHRTACPGIAGCITPGGEFFVPNQGRPLLGCEKLMIQGIPYFRLALGNETEVQLGDLAGNAMSLTVVCATMLAAVTCKELRRMTLASKHQNVERILSEAASLDGYKKRSSWAEVAALEEARKGTMIPWEGDPASSFFCELADLAPAAVQSSIWCTCETSGSNSLSTQFLQCRVCRVSCCRNCICTSAGYNLESHDTVDVDISVEDHNLASFQSKLRQIVPPTLVFGAEGIDAIAKLNGDEHRVTGLSNHVFSLHRIKRDRRKWLIIYYARENHGLGEAIAEFRITVGELDCEETASFAGKRVEMGMKGYLTSFVPACTEPLVYGPLDACAVVTVSQGSDDVQWRAKAADSTFASFSMEGEGETDSARIEVGLTDAASESLIESSKSTHNAKHFKAAKARGEERRWLYPKDWKRWPAKIHLRATSSNDTDGLADLVSGTYERARCRQTTNQSALWIKKGTGADPLSLYILVQPNVNRTGPDNVVVSSSLAHGDTSSILAVLPWTWQPSDALDPEAKDVADVVMKNWIPVGVGCMVPRSKIQVDSPRDASDVLVSVGGLSDSDMTMLCRDSCPTDKLVRLNATGGQRAQQTVRVFNSVCVPSILQYAAASGLKHDLSPEAPWIMLKDSSVPFGRCEKTIPTRPTETWFFDEERQIWDRRSEAGASRQYYLALQASPQPFELWADKAAKTLTVKYCPEVVGHRSASQLIEGRGDLNKLQDEVTVAFRLSDLTQQSDPIITPFKVSNCDSEEAVSVALSEPYELYERQQKVVSKMLAIEEAKTNFEELEMSEQELPGSSGISLIGRASRDRKLCGGVICDAIGSGKTVISIAMILNGLESARRSRAFPKQSGASLVVVPPGLIDQWASEIKKFSSGLKVVKVYDFNALNMLSVREIVEADVVIAPVDILEAKGYLERVVKCGKLGIKASDLPKLPQYSGQKEMIDAKGTWIPATSTDPYAGGNNPLSQKRRTESAYYTHVYLSSVHELREREFKPTDKGVPLEYFEWERVFVDEVHESLCTTRSEMALDTDGIFKEKNRRAGRELLGLTQKDIRRRPLVFRKAMFGLTGTPLLDSSNRVIELASLMGGTYVVGLSSHWRKLERESSRNIFLHNYLEPKQSREVRKNIYAKCQEYVSIACCRNKTGEEMSGIELVNHTRVVKMTEEEGKLYLKSQGGISPDKQSFAIKPEDFDVTAGHDISKFLRQNAKLECRGNELVRIVEEILARKGDEHTKILVFTDGRIGAGIAARHYLEASGLGCTYLDVEDSVETKNKKIAWYQRGDATAEDKKRPRVLVLHFEHAAGLNLQTECHDMILFSPLYVGEGGATSDPVSDASTEQQAIGRVFRPGQPNPVVNVFRIEVRGPADEECLDGQLIRRNTDEETIAMTVNAGDE